MQWILITLISIAFSSDFDDIPKSRSEGGSCDLRQSLVSKPFERVVGLGNCCVTKFQINKYFKGVSEEEIIGGAFVFDWMLPHSIDLLALSLSEGLRDVANKLYLQVIQAKWMKGKHYTVYNYRYDMSFNHLFEPEVNFAPANNNKPLLTPKYLERNFEKIESKLNHLIDKFIDLKNYSTLYVLAYPGSYMNQGVWPGLNMPSKESIKKLADSIKVLREGDENFTLLFVPAKKEFESFENVVVREIYPIEPPKLWIGDEEKWGKVFSEFSYASSSKPMLQLPLLSSKPATSMATQSHKDKAESSSKPLTWKDYLVIRSQKRMAERAAAQQSTTVGK